MFRVTTGTRRVTLILLALLLSVLVLLPQQSRGLLQSLGQPIAQIVALPLGVLAAINRSLHEVWEGYVALRHVHQENQRLHKEIQYLQGQVNELQESAAVSQRLAGLLAFKQNVGPETVAAQVIGRDSTNWYRGVVLNKGKRDGIHTEMGVITQAGVVGRVVKTTPVSSVVLLITDPNNAVTGLIQRTRDEGIVSGTSQGGVRMKYIPLLSNARERDIVVTSGLTGEFPKGLMIGSITRVEKAADDLFQSAEILPAADFSKLEEVLVILSPYPPGAADGAPAQPAASEKGSAP